MQPSTAPATPTEDPEEVRFRTRMEQIGGPKRRRRRSGDEEDDQKDRGFRLGWFGWLLVDAFIILATVGTVLTWPPIENCRAQEKSVGFYAGETVGQCIRRGIGQRIVNADQRIKMMLRGSGH
ncbi:hypothetical protein [Methylobacterium aerolatum]|uniref:RDD domain-containing protein n=1 Tax=Methylobacterium aerolatum TaxID=418708 RepID=A0ABU0I4M0_9HYPH|nr:hypothetical protein [Methylobacterium aerolatum]MDQ0449559.1 hypothetical protein [Methylobacterium aerolatum]GJD33589.1 hypothetical protein FMGBMHLM_0479 [Methylobacterium aerolatum]